ncbi:MAG: ABC transporter ATP-binding protein [Cellulosilyticaceae bacterium]
MFKKFIAYYKSYKGLFIMDLVVAFVAALCDLVYPMMTRELVDQSIPNRDIRMVFVFAGTLLVIYGIKYACNYFMQYWGHVVGVRMQADMRRDVFKHLQKLPCTFFDNTKTGDIMSRIINDLMDISELAHHGPEDLFISGVMIIGSFILLLRINGPLTIIVFACIPLIFLFTWKKKDKMRKSFLATRVKTGEVNAILENSIAGIRVSKSFGGYEHEMEKFEKGNKNFTAARENAYQVMAQYFAGAELSLNLLDYISLIVGGLFTYAKMITIGDFMAYLLYVKMFTQPIKKLINFMEQYQSGMTGFMRYNEIMALEEETDKNDAIAVQTVEGEIRFENVSFKYENEYVLKDINLSIPKGEMLALVGPSGGGKSTFCNLIPRFYEVNAGDIKIDNQSIYNMELESLRNHIGIVQQDVFLFTGTIKDNICYGKQNATDEVIIEAAKRANIHEFVMRLPEGYNTYIGERGVKLSGGQKQRLSIARVFLKNPAILILDEATSALDNATEALIQQSIEDVCKNRTTIVVAHRLSTIKHAHKIAVLGDNGIEEEGSHEELLALGGTYKSLYDAQFQDKVNDEEGR